MIDWVTAVIPFRHKRINNGHVQKIDSDGVERWLVACPKQFEGSFESSIAVKSNEISECLQYADKLYISGNPSKFLQGHNVIGTDDLNLLVERTLDAISEQAGFTVDEVTRRRIRSGLYFVKRLDINYMFQLPSLSDVRAFIDAAGIKTRTRHGRSTIKKGTFYVGQTSRRWALKGYSKFDEIMGGEKGHRLPPHLFQSPLVGFTEDKLRLELVLRAPELKKITDDENPSARQILELGISSLFNEYVSRLEMTANVSIKDEKLASLPSKIQGTYALWRQGFDVRSMLPKATFYRHKTMLKDYEIDISLPHEQCDNHASNVVPLVRVLEAKPVTIPQHLLSYIVH